MITMKLKQIITGFCITLSVYSYAQQAERQWAIDNYHRYYQEAKQVTDKEKQQAIVQLRTYFHSHPYRLKADNSGKKALEFLKLLKANGTFEDMNPTEERFERENTYQKGYGNTTTDEVGIFIAQAYERLFHIATAHRLDLLDKDLFSWDAFWKAIIHYGEIEIRRPNDKPRFHASCFAIPTAAVNVYFALLPQMEEAERNEGSPLMKGACDMLKTVGLEAWTQPLRNDETDKNVVSLERFRNHVWWVGGNALGYRSLLPVAVMYHSIPMVDLLAQVSQKGISTTSQTTYHDSFWTEGFTADGAGWGHGMQCLVWGYPIDGASNALNLLNMLRGTPWSKQLSTENKEALMNFFRGGNWYYYKGFRLPGLDRGSYAYNPTPRSIPYTKMLNNVMENWLSSFTLEEQSELKKLQAEVKQNNILMEGYPAGAYSGVRWFFNNDDLMKKTPQYHLCINMSSVRTDGLESAAFADNYNFYPTDGATLFQRDGNEYFQIMGGWDVTAMPGVTAREGMDKLTAVTNWRGYCSKYNYAAGATDSKENGVAGYIFEKMNGSDKKDVNDRGDRDIANDILYNFQAYKGYFILGDYFVGLGAGVTNLAPEREGHIRTTVDQTAWTDEVYVTHKGKKYLLTAPDTILSGKEKEPVWITQNNKFSYCRLPQYTSQLYISRETKTADWVKMNPTNKNIKNLPAEVRVLRIWADHGQTPQNETYGYVVYTGQGVPTGKLPFEVLRNDTLVQAIRSLDKQTIQAVFYPGNNGLKASKLNLKVSSPCAVMIQQQEGEMILSVTDATMNPNLKEIEIIFNNKSYSIPLPQGKDCGNCVTMRTKLK
mgnify:CR=1 FL=1